MPVPGFLSDQEIAELALHPWDPDTWVYGPQYVNNLDEWVLVHAGHTDGSLVCWAGPMELELAVYRNPGVFTCKQHILKPDEVIPIPIRLRDARANARTISAPAIHILDPDLNIIQTIEV
jgi:hypothetical protein